MRSYSNAYVVLIAALVLGPHLLVDANLFGETDPEPAAGFLTLQRRAAIDMFLRRRWHPPEPPPVTVITIDTSCGCCAACRTPEYYTCTCCSACNG